MNDRKIPLPTAVLMIAVAGTIDVIQFLITLVPLIGLIFAPLISICAAFLFGLWFSHLGIPMLDPKRVLLTLGTLLGEITPFLNILPMWTIRVTYTIIAERTA